MTYINNYPVEPDLITAMVRSMQNNGWKLLHRFTKIHVSPAVFKTTVVAKKISAETEPPPEGTEQEPANVWKVPTGLHPGNFKAYLQKGASLRHLDSSEYIVTNTTVEFLVPKEDSVLYIYHPDGKSGVEPGGNFTGTPSDSGSPTGGSSGSLGNFFEAHYGTHYIIENNQLTEEKRKSIYGIARYSRVAVPYGMFSVYKPFLAPKEDNPLLFEIVDQGDVISKALQLSLSRPGFTKPSIYTYMLDSYKNPDAGGDPPQHTGYTLTLPGDSKRIVMDAEIFKNEWYADKIGDTPKSRITFVFPEHYQSPIVENDYRHPDLAKTLYHTEYNTLTDVGNFWPDSKCWLKGCVDEGTAIFMIRSATAPSFDVNATPIIPIYLGEGVPLEGYERKDGDGSQLDLLFGGTVPKGPLKNVPTFDFDDPDMKKFYAPLLPIMREYEPSMGNGIDNIIVRKAIDGTRHLAHYISTSAPPHMMPPDRIHDENGMQYPRAWQQPTNSEFNYKFNPSAYSGNVTAGEGYLMHPEHGMRGKIRNIIMTNPLSILNEDTLRITNDYCADPTSPDKYQDYTYFLVEGISPFTKKPSVQYRPMGTALIQKSDGKEGGDGQIPPGGNTGAIVGDDNGWDGTPIDWGDINSPSNPDSSLGGGGSPSGPDPGGGGGGTGGGGAGNNYGHLGTDLGKVIAFTPPGDAIWSDEALGYMAEGETYAIVCNDTKSSGCKYNLYFNGYKIASGIDVEGGGKHKAIRLDASKLVNGKGMVTVESLQNKQLLWYVYIMTYDQVKEYIPNHTSIPASALSLAHTQINYEDNTSVPSKIVGDDDNFTSLSFSV